MCVCVCIYIYIHVCVCVCVYIYINVHICISICINKLYIDMYGGGLRDAAAPPKKTVFLFLTNPQMPRSRTLARAASPPHSFLTHSSPANVVEKPLHPPTRVVPPVLKASFKALLRIYSGSIKALFKLY